MSMEDVAHLQLQVTTQLGDITYSMPGGEFATLITIGA